MSGERVLIVEDDAILAQHLADTLTGYGYRTDPPLATGEEAVSQVQLNPPDLILMDIKLLGEMTGIEAAQQILKTHDIPIIYLTAYSDPELLRQAIGTEPYAYLVKPVQSSEVRTTIEVALYKHRLDRKVKASERKYRALAEAIPDPVFITGHDDTVLYVNTRAAESLHLPADEIAGKPRKSLFPPDIVEEQGRDLQTVFTTGKPLRKDVRVLHGEHEFWQENFIVPCKDETGNVTAVLGISRDISSRKVAEEAQKKSEALLNEMGRTAKVGGWEFDAETLEQVWTEEVYRIHEVDMSYKPTVSSGIVFYAPSARPIIEKAIRRAIEYGEPFDLELEFITAKGNHRWVHAVGKAVLKHGKTRKVTGTFQDITNRKKAEDALEESHRMLETASVAGHVALWEWDIESGTLKLSALFDTMLGYEPGEFPRNVTGWQEIIHPYDRVRVSELLEAHLKYGTPYDAEYRVRKKQGEYIWWHDAAQVTTFRDGKPSVMSGACSDITKKKDAEAAIVESEKKFRAVFDAAQDGMLVADPESRRFVMANTAFLKQTGYTEAEMLSVSVNDIHPQADLPYIVGQFDKQVRGEIDVSTNIPVLRKDGTVFFADINSSGLTLQGRQYTLGIFRDITERKQAEAALVESEQKFRIIFDAAQDGMVVADPETHRFVMANAAFQKQLGYTEGELLNMSVTDIHPPADLPYVMEQFEKQARREIDLAPDMPLLRKDGTVFFTDINTSLVTLQGRQHMLGIFRDVTERKQAEEALRDMLAEKEVLMLEIHHRVKNNLAVIISLLGMHADSIHDEQVLATIRDMQGRIAIMAQVHQSLYDSKNVSEINFSEFIQTLSDRQMQSLGGEHRIDLTIDGGDCTVSLDVAIPAGLIVNELVTNAIKHAFPGGHPPPVRADEPCRITIGFTQTDDEYTLVVSDNGIGIPPDFDWRTTRSLGLRLVNILVRHQLRGSIDMNAGKGTEFVLKFRDPRKKRSESL